jgi:hypothetical protein
MLKKYSTDYQLWNAYAQIEVKSGKVQEAENVYVTALSFANFSSLDVNQSLHVDMLFLSYVLLLIFRFVELELSQGQTERSLSIIVAYVERRAPPDQSASQDVKPMQILKARRAFEFMVAQEQQDDRKRLIAIQVFFLSTD